MVSMGSVHLHTRGIGRACEIVRHGEPAIAGLIEQINLDDGTIDVRTFGGTLIPRVPKRVPETKFLPLTWQWIGADEPPNPPPPPKKAIA